MQCGKQLSYILSQYRWKGICATVLVENRICNCNPQRYLHTSNPLFEFHEYDRRSGYDTGFNVADKRIDRIRIGLGQLKQEIKQWKEELKETWEADPILEYRAGEIDVYWKFGNESSLNHWIVTSDSDHAEGFSKCELKLSHQGYGMFCGNLCSRVPKDGRMQNSGYCNIITKRVTKAFQLNSYFDWNPYTHLNMRVRGDGRSYLLNIHISGQYDILWNDVFSFVLYTRGGPYWQTVKIPFSKFFFASKGRIQDSQAPLPLAKISHFGITVSDRADGPFQLEIDYVGTEFDPTHNEETAYEMYNVEQNYIIGT